MRRIAMFVFVIVAVLCLPAGASSIPQRRETHATVTTASVSVPLVQAEFLLVSQASPIDDSASPTTPANSMKTYTVVLSAVLLLIVALRLALAFRLEECL